LIWIFGGFKLTSVAFLKILTLSTRFDSPIEQIFSSPSRKVINFFDVFLRKVQVLFTIRSIWIIKRLKFRFFQKSRFILSKIFISWINFFRLPESFSPNLCFYHLTKKIWTLTVLWSRLTTSCSKLELFDEKRRKNWSLFTKVMKKVPRDCWVKKNEFCLNFQKSAIEISYKFGTDFHEVMN
jgi:hypothetical protein